MGGRRCGGGAAEPQGSGDQRRLWDSVAHDWRRAYRAGQPAQVGRVAAPRPADEHGLRHLAAASECHGKPTHADPARKIVRSGHELSVGPQEPSLTLGLRGIEARASYNVSVAHGYAAGKAEAMAGAKLAGLAVALEPSTSVVVRYHAM